MTASNSYPESASSEASDPEMREAITWLVRLNSGEETAADCENFEKWKAASESHAAAARRAASLWQTLPPALQSYGGRRRRMTSPALVLCAGLALMMAIYLPHPLAQFVADFRTSTGEIRRVTLKDGSVVDLDTATSFDVSADQRTISLHTGQIFVKVAPDPSRPFKVVTRKAETLALGTAFAVRLDAENERITVTEHAVRVTPQGQGIGVEVTEGHVLEIAADGTGRPVATDVEAMVAWRQGGMQFREKPLGAVLAEVERYRYGRIVVMDEALRRLPITGSFAVGDTDAFLQAATLSLPIRMVSMPGLVVLWRDTGRALPAR